MPLISRHTLVQPAVHSFPPFWRREISGKTVHLFDSHVTGYDIISIYHRINGWFIYGLRLMVDPMLCHISNGGFNRSLTHPTRKHQTFGKAWTPERFPRLVILHSKPLPREEKMKRSFNFNKLSSSAFLGRPWMDRSFEKTKSSLYTAGLLKVVKPES